MEKLTELINAAEHGSVEAMYELGMMYYSGDGVTEDEERAMKWLKRAADNGDSVSKELYNQLNAEKHDCFLNKLLGMDYIYKYGKAVVLHCGSCGRACSESIQTHSRWIKLAAYPCSLVESERLNLGRYKVGKKWRMWVFFPFYCKIGDTFSVAFGKIGYHPTSRFITCQLLGIIKIEKTYAYITVKVISEGNYLSFVQEVDAYKKNDLEKTHCYDYSPQWYPKGCNVGDRKKQEEGTRIEERVYLCSCNEGPDRYKDYIYTDDDGIDHLVQSNYSSYHETECLYGDKVLGYHKYCPIEIKDGAAIQYTTR